MEVVITTEDYKLEVTPKIESLSSNIQTMQTYQNEYFNLTIINQTSDSLTTISYNNISITKNTTAEVILNRTSPNLTMYIDYNRDNVTDEEKSPDTIETDYAPNATIILPVNKGDCTRFND